MSLDWSTGALAKGVACYRNGEFFEAHEHWEDVWRTAEGPEKTLLQGLIQIAAAFHHLERQNAVGACSLLRSARRKLEEFPQDAEAVPLVAICQSVSEWIVALSCGASTERYPALPPI